MPLKFLEEDREIEYKGYKIISCLPDEDVKSIFHALQKDHRLLYKVNPYSLEVQEPFPILYDDYYFAIIISKNNILIEKLETKPE